MLGVSTWDDKIDVMSDKRTNLNCYFECFWSRNGHKVASVRFAVTNMLGISV
jgi:hypothetical protein